MFISTSQTTVNWGILNHEIMLLESAHRVLNTNMVLWDDDDARNVVIMRVTGWTTDKCLVQAKNSFRWKCLGRNFEEREQYRRAVTCSSILFQRLSLELRVSGHNKKPRKPMDYACHIFKILWGLSKKFWFELTSFKLSVSIKLKHWTRESWVSASLKRKYSSL